MSTQLMNPTELVERNWKDAAALMTELGCYWADSTPWARERLQVLEDLLSDTQRWLEQLDVPLPPVPRAVFEQRQAAIGPLKEPYAGLLDLRDTGLRPRLMYHLAYADSVAWLLADTLTAEQREQAVERAMDRSMEFAMREFDQFVERYTTWNKAMAEANVRRIYRASLVEFLNALWPPRACSETLERLNQAYDLQEVVRHDGYFERRFAQMYDIWLATQGIDFV